MDKLIVIPTIQGKYKYRFSENRANDFNRGKWHNLTSVKAPARSRELIKFHLSLSLTVDGFSPRGKAIGWDLVFATQIGEVNDEIPNVRIGGVGISV